MSPDTLARGLVMEEASGQQLEVLGSISLGTGGEVESVGAQGEAECGVLDTTCCPHHPTLGHNTILHPVSSLSYSNTHAVKVTVWCLLVLIIM